MNWTVIDSDYIYHDVTADLFSVDENGFVTFWDKAEGKLNTPVGTFYHPAGVYRKEEEA
jgi:hypothetical protein